MKPTLSKQSSTALNKDKQTKNKITKIHENIKKKRHKDKKTKRQKDITKTKRKKEKYIKTKIHIGKKYLSRHNGPRSQGIEFITSPTFLIYHHEYTLRFFQLSNKPKFFWESQFFSEKNYGDVAPFSGTGINHLGSPSILSSRFHCNEYDCAVKNIANKTNTAHVTKITNISNKKDKFTYSKDCKHYTQVRREMCKGWICLQLSLLRR